MTSVVHMTASEFGRTLGALLLTLQPLRPLYFPVTWPAAACIVFLRDHLQSGTLAKHLNLRGCRSWHLEGAGCPSSLDMSFAYVLCFDTMFRQVVVSMSHDAHSDIDAKQFLTRCKAAQQAFGHSSKDTDQQS